ncbi:hypothetical protein [Rhodococcus aetherivorans]|uniref:hypothetical protein n=1 Tax=Rhodococcus aetherivorans TaxID=191292 RepID=UPI001260C69E|nr:hypothetical protein [Rhodococcus aetherivorans]NGP27964.1 hypothetical protein [Rhodococcus aetherivorans]
MFERVDGGDAAGLACGVLGGLRRKRERGAAAQVGRTRVPAGYVSTRSSVLSVPSRPKYSPSGRTTMVAAKRSPPTWRTTDEQGPDVAVRCVHGIGDRIGQNAGIRIRPLRRFTSNNAP